MHSIGMHHIQKKSGSIRVLLSNHVLCEINSITEYLGVCTVYSRYSGHVYSGHSDIVATFPGTKYIYSISLYSGRI